jgi:hypothetical protein
MSSIFSYKEKKTKWKILSFSLIGMLIASSTAVFFQIPQQVLNSSVTGQQGVNAPPLLNVAYGAGVLTNVFALPADNIFSTRTYYTIAFTTATTGAIRDIEMTFPAGFNVATAKLLEVQGIGAGSLSVSGQTVKYTVSSPVSIPAQRAIKISLADITNSATTSNQIAVTTKAISGPNIEIIDGPTNSAVFTLAQVSNAMLASNAVTGPKITANSVDNTKIQDGQVTVADLAANSVDNTKIQDGQVGWLDLAANSVDASKIRDGSIGKAEVSTAFIKKVTIPDQNSDPLYTWSPGALASGGGRSNEFGIGDPNVKDDSVISITLLRDQSFADCLGAPSIGADLHATGRIRITCNHAPSDNSILTYVLINYEQANIGLLFPSLSFFLSPLQEVSLNAMRRLNPCAYKRNITMHFIRYEIQCSY